MQHLCNKFALDLRPARAAAERSEKRRTPPRDRVAGSSESFGHFGFLVFGFREATRPPTHIVGVGAKRAKRLRLRPRASARASQEGAHARGLCNAGAVPGFARAAAAESASEPRSTGERLRREQRAK